MIKHVSLKHGWYYHFRIHSEKARVLCKNNHTKLKDFLYKTFENCPGEHFEEGPRSSALKFPINVSLKEEFNHEVSTLCMQGLKNMPQYKTSHSKVQMFMLQFDKNTISMEIPIWLFKEEYDDFEKIFKTTQPLSGHIDVLRIEDDEKIWIWDYKPNAQKEKYAATQVYFYALMLSKRTGVPIENIRCGYFDENIAYSFKPAQNVLNQIYF
ncbi:MAG: PD-(D/E)XK nuclease family protein [Nanoarchaeota archaeon]|nr:PD-(D/E)XK nuclease family protein [Nanoarchaeota archaeon]MBU1029998.1 PD-(D/E)XK nuclease family protein [Nanoarchaeota archaeon]MBU1850184.1 PD-(D/E)XK nuclease family protein [Nanoarchaeota archaeon]